MIDRLFAILSVDERQRAGRFATAALRERFIVARGFMRQRLASDARAKPSQLVFTYGPQGKPALETGAVFNLSHTDRLACLATLRCAPEIAASVSLGVDIETLSSVDAGLERHALSETELAHYATLPPEKRQCVFFRTWTRKEAVMKACGRGLSLSPRSITVDLEHADRSAVLSLPPDLPDPSQWFLYGFAAQKGTLGAVALTKPPGTGVNTKTHWWDL